MITLNSKQVSEFIASNEFCILQFGSESCMPCKAISNRLDTWNQIPCAYISIDENREYCAQHDVFTVPTLRFYWESKMMRQVSGYFSLDQFLAYIKENTPI